jgi:hypothetical protein
MVTRLKDCGGPCDKWKMIEDSIYPFCSQALLLYLFIFNFLSPYRIKARVFYAVVEINPDANKKHLSRGCSMSVSCNVFWKKRNIRIFWKDWI